MSFCHITFNTHDSSSAAFMHIPSSTSMLKIMRPRVVPAFLRLSGSLVAFPKWSTYTSIWWKSIALRPSQRQRLFGSAKTANVPDCPPRPGRGRGTGLGGRSTPCLRYTRPFSASHHRAILYLQRHRTRHGSLIARQSSRKLQTHRRSDVPAYPVDHRSGVPGRGVRPAMFAIRQCVGQRMCLPSGLQHALDRQHLCPAGVRR